MPIHRREAIQRIEDALRVTPVVGIIGARQVGKTSLARELRLTHPGPPLLDLERPADLERIADPELALRELSGLIVLDEVQQLPALFPVLRVLVDRPGNSTRFVLTGSASPGLLRLGSESLAGRITWIPIEGFNLEELGDLDTLWVRGGFPRSALAESDADAAAWRRAYLQALLHRDLPALGIDVPTRALERMLVMLAHRHGQPWNGAAFARALGVSQPTVRRWLDILVGAFLLRELKPWHANVEKRQVRSPKVYLRDVGILHTLLDLDTRRDIERHPIVGVSWEGLVLREAERALGAREDQSWFWATHAGAELDLLVTGSRRVGVEVKRTTAPTLTPSMRVALADLELDILYVIHAGDGCWKMADRVEAVAAREMLQPGRLG